MLRTRAAFEGERKEVTALIVDVAGSLAMAEALDPEDVHAVMNGFFALALEAVHGEGGTINQFRGDGLMALFGAPQARGDDAARALRAALQIRSASRGYSESVRARHGLPFAIRIGVNTGLVWVGAIGDGLRRDYTAEGPTVGIAARLEADAAPGQILVGGETVRRCGAFFELADLGSRSVRGVAEPVGVFELLGEGVHRARFSVERERGLTAFVGRSRELALVLRAVELAEGVRFVELRGEAGVGKSRLALEAMRRQPADVFTLTMACHESTAQRAFLPWLELLRAWPEGLPRHAALAPLVGRLEGREGPGVVEVEASLRQVLGAVLASRPLLVGVEDAQWMDPSSRQLIRRLAEEPMPGALGFLATLRDEGELAWGTAASPVRIDLAPLPGADAHRLAESMLEGVEAADELAELACLRAGGNPLFLEEVARALCEGPASARAAARMEVSLSRAPERLPRTLHGVVAARIDSLDEPEKHFLQAAAVLAQPFDRELLAEVEPPKQGDPEALVATLLDRGLIRATGPGEFDFCHGVVRSGAYDQLVRARRRDLHRRVADALAKRSSAQTPDGASRIGDHYDRAGDAEAAIPHLHRAGRAYLALEAPAEAAVHLRHAFELAQQRPQRDGSQVASIGLALATSLNILDQGGEAGAVLEGLDPERLDLADRKRMAQAWIQTGWLRFSSGDGCERARALVERGLAVAEALPRGAGVAALANSYLSRMLALDGRPDDAVRCARRMGELASARGDTSGVVAARYNECSALCDAGRVDEAHRAALDADQLARGTRNDLVLGAALVSLASVHLVRGDPERAIAVAERGFAAGESVGQLGLLYNATLISGYAYLLQGDVGPASEAFERLAEINGSWPSTLLHRARGRLELGDLAEAEALAERCVAEGAHQKIVARALALLGFTRGLAGEPSADRCEALLRESIRLCDEGGMRPYLAEAHGFLAELAGRSGDGGRASYFSERAATGYEACGMPLHAEIARAAGRPRS